MGQLELEVVARMIAVERVMHEREVEVGCIKGPAAI